MKKVFILILFGMFLTGCESKPEQQDIFEKPICQLPCWMSITPGITTKDEALAALSKIDIVDRQVVDMTRSTIIGFDDEIRFSFYNDDNFSGSINILNNRVSMMSFVIPTRYSGIRLEHAIELFGLPQSILVLHSGLFDQITLLDPQKGIAFGYKLYGNQSLESSDLGPAVEIREVDFFDSNHYQEVLNSRELSAGILNGDQIKNSIRPWNGYGSIKEKYWPPATQSPQ